MCDERLNIRVLQCEADDSEDSHFRFLVDGKNVKYVSIAPGLFSVDDLIWNRMLLPHLPPFPAGDWNVGHIAQSKTTDAPCFAWTRKDPLPTIQNCWHPTSVDHSELQFGQRVRSNVFVVTSPRFDRPVVAKFACFLWEVHYFERECTAYEWLVGQDIGPRFLGLLTEEGRAYGFLMDRIENARHATPDDLHMCQEALSRLHGLNILHGDLNKHNFLIKDNQAILIDFEYAERTTDQSALQEEMNRLPEVLADMSGNGGEYTEEALAEMSARGGA